VTGGVKRGASGCRAHARVATTTFTYDDRGRLLREIRTSSFGDPTYDFRYEYDQGGNRTVKVGSASPLPEKRYDYIYDKSSDPNHEASLYDSTANNRLMRVDRHSGDTVGSRVEHVDDYFYNHSGNVTRIVSHDVALNGGIFNMAAMGGGGMMGPIGGGDPEDYYTAVRFVYAKNGRTVTFAIGEHWYWDGTPETPPTGYGVDWGREYRYDGARQRYLDRELNALQLQGGDVLADATTNTHYDSDSPYWSVRSETGGGDVETGFALGTGRINDLGGTPSTDYYHTDMLGTTRFLTDASGGEIEPAVYTAFGELVSGTSGRFGYVGAYGYQSHDEMPYQHVGARYYDPTTGRFLQRDPIGVKGGLNVYLYVQNSPASAVDPLGLFNWFEASKWAGAALITGAAAAGSGGLALPIIAGVFASGWAGGFTRSDANWWGRQFRRFGFWVSCQAAGFADAASSLDNVDAPDWKGNCIRGCHREHN